MNSTKTARRLGTALAVPALLLVAACGSEDESTNGSGGASASAVVTGELGEAPQIEFDEDTDGPDETRVSVLHDGDDGPVESGDYVRVDAVGVMQDGTPLFSTWGFDDYGAEDQEPEGSGDDAAEDDAAEDGDTADEATDGEDPAAEADDTAEEGAEAEDAAANPSQYIGRAGEENEMLPLDGLVGEQVGSRVLVEGTVADLLGPEAAQMGLAEDDAVAWVFDVAGTASVDPQAELEGEQEAGTDGMPEVTAEAGEPATITIPEGEDAPDEFQEQVLIEGDGPVVTSGEAAIVHYTGVTWEDGEMFDSSWEHGSATPFQVGTGSVIEGFDIGLEGKHVGDRVLVVMPPEMAYGHDPTSELAEDTLVFVMDIVGVV